MYKAEYSTFGQRAHHLLVKSRRGDRIGPGFRRFLVFVQFIAMDTDELTVAEVAEFTNVSKTTARKALWSLHTDGYLTVDRIYWRSNTDKLVFKLVKTPDLFPPHAYEKLVNYTLYRQEEGRTEAEYVYLK